MTGRALPRLGARRFSTPVPILLTLGAVVAGLLAATQPPAVAAVLLGTAALALLAAVTPLAALVAMLALAPLRTLISTEASFPLPLDIGQLTLAVFIFAWGIHQLTREQRSFRLAWSPVYAPILLFTVAGGISAFAAISLGAWLTDWLKWVQMLILAALTLTLAGDRRWEWLLSGLTAAAVANGLIGIYEFFGGSGALVLLVNGRYFRAFGTFGQPNPFGGFMGLIAPLAVMALLGYAANIWSRWRAHQRNAAAQWLPLLFYAFASAVIVIALLLSWSRGSWLGFGASVLVMAFALPRQVGRSLALMGTVVLVVAALWLTGRLPASIIARVSSATEELFAFSDVRGVDITGENYAVFERLAHWQAAVNMATAHPWFGVGLGNYEIAYPDYRLINWKFPLGHAHNYYLNVLAEAGIIGLIAYTVTWVCVFILTWRVRRHPDRLSRLVAIGLLGTWTYLSVHSLTDDLYVNNLFLHLGVMMGLLAVLYHQTWNHHRLRML